MFLSLFSIGTGAALGAWLRWGLGLWLNPHHATLPLGMLAANLVGGYGVGLALGWFAQTPGLSPELRLIVINGLLGGLTTFSTFALDTVQMLLRQQSAWAVAPVATPVRGIFSKNVMGPITHRA